MIPARLAPPRSGQRPRGARAALWRAELRNAPLMITMNDARDLNLAPLVPWGPKGREKEKRPETRPEMMRRIL